MSLFIISLFALLANTLLQTIPEGHVVDVISPVIAAVGLAAPRKTAFAWTAIMALLWSAFISPSFVTLILLWSSIVWFIGSISRDIAWDHRSVGATVAILVSLFWHYSLLLIDLFSGHPPAIDIFTLGTLLIRPITSGILFIVLANVLVRAANPRLGSSRR
jgi:hypothetical protein